MNGCQLPVFTEPAAAKTNTRIATILMMTMTLFARALSRTPRTRIQVSTMITSSAGTLKIAARELPSDNHRLGKLLRQVESEQRVQNVIEVCRESDRDSHVRNRVLEDEVPADDPGKYLAERRVGVGIRASRNRNHGGELGVAERRKTAHECHQQEGKRDARTRARPADGRRRASPMHDEVENRSVQDGGNGESLHRRPPFQ